MPPGPHSTESTNGSVSSPMQGRSTTSLAQDLQSITQNPPAIQPTHDPSGAALACRQTLTTAFPVMQNHTSADNADSESQDVVDRPESESASAAASNTIPVTSDTSISRSQILIPNSQVHNIVRTLRLYARWTYPQLHEALGISLSTLHRIVNDNHPPTSHTEDQHLNVNNELSNTSRRSIVNAETQQRFIATATASAHNRRLPFTQIAKLAGIKLSKATLKKVFKSAGYNRRVARKKAFLSTSAKEKRHAWGERFRD